MKDLRHGLGAVGEAEDGKPFGGLECMEERAEIVGQIPYWISLSWKKKIG